MAELQLELSRRDDQRLERGTFTQQNPTKGALGVGLQRGTGHGPRPLTTDSLSPVCDVRHSDRRQGRFCGGSGGKGGAEMLQETGT